MKRLEEFLLKRRPLAADVGIVAAGVLVCVAIPGLLIGLALKYLGVK